MNETQRKRRGHAFLPPKAVLRRIPKLYETDGQDFDEKTIWAHYFVGAWDWYIAELDPETNEVFGYTRHAKHPSGAEWGYIQLDQLECLTVPGTITGLPISFPVERDMHWTPVKFKEINHD